MKVHAHTLFCFLFCIMIFLMVAVFSLFNDNTVQNQGSSSATGAVGGYVESDLDSDSDGILDYADTDIYYGNVESTEDDTTNFHY